MGKQTETFPFLLGKENSYRGLCLERKVQYFSRNFASILPSKAALPFLGILLLLGHSRSQNS